MRKEVKNWLAQAKDDLKKAEDNFKASHLDGAAFFCQQSIEKALKALLIQTSGNFPKIHDIVALARMTNAPPDVVNKCKKINPYYTETRYPDFSKTIPAKAFSKEEIEEVIKLSKEALNWIEKSLTSPR